MPSNSYSSSPSYSSPLASAGIGEPGDSATRHHDLGTSTSSAAERRENTPATFDLDEMLEEMPGGIEMAVELASLFLTECPAVLRQIREGLESESPRLVRRGAHTLKSSAGIFCAQAMVEAAWQLERLASEHDCTRLQEPYKVLEREAAKVTEDLRRLCADG